MKALVVLMLAFFICAGAPEAAPPPKPKFRLFRKIHRPHNAHVKKVQRANDKKRHRWTHLKK